MSVLNNSNAIESGGYNIDRSLRFRSSASAYLSRTQTTGNQKTFTASAWVKRGVLGVRSAIFSAGGNANDFTFIGFDIDNTIRVLNYLSTTKILDRNTTAVYRDCSAWYHILVVFDTTNATATLRQRIYINGAEVTSFTNTTLSSLNDNTYFNQNTIGAFVGRDISINQYFDGYLAEVNFIDGQALTPSSFGQTDAVTGVWTPKKYTGTYGTNGFYLDFKDNTSATTLAYDKSGNGNNWTPNNISTTAGATYDSMTDVPTLTSATAANYCVMNPLSKAGGNLSFQNGNLTVVKASASTQECSFSTLGISTGKYYWEVTPTAFSYLSLSLSTGVPANATYGYRPAKSVSWTNGVGIRNNAGTVLNSTTFAANNVIGFALDCDSATLAFYKNGTLIYTMTSLWTALGLSGPTDVFATTAHDDSSNTATVQFNFGQRPFFFTPPTGFKALNTFNLPDPVIKKPNQYMDATLWTGNSGSQSVSNSGFQPDFVWIKNRSNAYSHILQDAVRGVGKTLQSNTTNTEQNNGVLTSFDTSGFSLNNLTGDNVGSLVGWQWKESATSGFDIVTYTGNGVSGRAVPHSLGVAPKMVIVKSRTGAFDWSVWHTGIGVTQYLVLNGTAAAVTDTTVFNGSFTSTQFTVGTFGGVNANGANLVAYLFAEIAGFSKFGSYTGNGSTDGPFVYCGFRPKYVMVKCSSTTANWNVIDTSRNQYNVSNSALFPGDSLAEQTGTTSGYVMEDIVSNGFKLRMDTASINANGATYIYAAFAESPFKTSNAR